MVRWPPPWELQAGLRNPCTTLLRFQVRQACAFVGLLHTDFMHLAGSLLPWAVLAFLLELNYGSIRVVILWLVTLLGGAFTSALLDPPCQVVRARLTPA